MTSVDDIGPNALTDVPWMPIDGTYLTPRDVLLNAHQLPSFGSSISGYEVGSTFRVSAALFALVSRELGGRMARSCAHLPEGAIDAALGGIASAAHLRDPVQPFLQRPRVADSGGSDTRLGTGEKPVEKLDPTSPSDQSSEFWNLAASRRHVLGEADLCLALAVYHHYSMAGNNSYNADKCTMGAPGIRFLGAGNSATEVLWEGRNLLESLRMNTPRAWCEGTGLPAWADRACAVSREGMGEHPLWRATWSANTAAVHWDGNHASGVRIGGVPHSWFTPAMGADKETRKSWWDQRNTEDPLYLYVADAHGDLKAQRLDIGLDATEMAVHWNAVGNPSERRRSSAHCVLAPTSTSKLVFIRHRVEGTASSPMIRASEVFRPDAEKWAPNEDVAEALGEQARQIERMLAIVASPFRRAGKGGSAYVLDLLAPRRSDLITAFWRRLGPVFDRMVSDLDSGHGKVSTKTWQAARIETLGAFDDTVEPSYGQLSARIEFVRGHVARRLDRVVREVMEGDGDE